MLIIIVLKLKNGVKKHIKRLIATLFIMVLKQGNIQIKRKGPLITLPLILTWYLVSAEASPFGSQICRAEAAILQIFLTWLCF